MTKKYLLSAIPLIMLIGCGSNGGSINDNNNQNSVVQQQASPEENTTNPDTAIPDTTNPAATNPDVADSGATDSNTNNPNTANTNTANTNTANSTMISNAVKDHNNIRKEVFNGNELTWSDAIAQSAQDYVDKLANNGKFEHESGISYGENLFASSYQANYSDAIRGWAEEKVHYHYDTNSCDSGETCGHYTQIIWRDSVEVGCGIATYTTGEYEGWTVVACRYNPPGNINNEKPY